MAELERRVPCGEEVLDKFARVARHVVTVLLRRGKTKKVFVNCNEYSMVNSLDRYTLSRGTGGYYCVERIETYGSFKPLRAMEFPESSTLPCQGCLTRSFANFVSVALFLPAVIASRALKEYNDI